MIELDGTANKGNSAPTPFSVSPWRRPGSRRRVGLPLYRYLGGLQKLLPVPFMNILNGGEHADNNVDIQEFMIVPAGQTALPVLCRWEQGVPPSEKILSSRGLSSGRRWGGLRQILSRTPPP